METIRNYLETMFMQLPNTPEVQRAKNELLSMMEDKYSELLAEGKPENEAVGIVISEFGNLDELAGDLGIGTVMEAHEPLPGRLLTMEEIRAFLSNATRRAYNIALGVMLCICCAVPVIIGDSVAGNSELGDGVGVILLLAMICAAEGLFIYSGFMAEEWKFLDVQNCFLDFAGSQYVEECRQAYKTQHSLLITFGVILCIFCAVPAVFFNTLFSGIDFFGALSGALVLIFVGIGVFLLVFGSSKMGAYDRLLALNRTGTIGGQYAKSQREERHFSNRTVGTILSVWWPTITCIYLIWSFLTFRWGITWIIWPIAAIARGIVINLAETEEENHG